MQWPRRPVLLTSVIYVTNRYMRRQQLSSNDDQGCHTSEMGYALRWTECFLLWSNSSVQSLQQAVFCWGIHLERSLPCYGNPLLSDCCHLMQYVLVYCLVWTDGGDYNSCWRRISASLSRTMSSQFLFTVKLLGMIRHLIWSACGMTVNWGLFSAIFAAIQTKLYNQQATIHLHKRDSLETTWDISI